MPRRFQFSMRTLLVAILDLAANIMDDDLEALRDLPNLQKLDLTDRPITDAAVPTLCRLRRLRVLKVCGTKTTENGISRLRAALPECTIEW